MGNGLTSAVNAIKDVPTRRTIMALGLELRRVDRSVTTLVRNNQAVQSFALDSITLTAGNGLIGGGDLTADRAFAVGAGLGISVSADAVAVDQTMVPTWTGIHTYSAQDVHNAGLSLGTSGVLASAEDDSTGTEAGFTFNLTTARSTNLALLFQNTADGNRYIDVSANGEFGFGKNSTTLFQTGWVLGFVANTTNYTGQLGGVLGATLHNNSGASPAQLHGLRGYLDVTVTSGTGDISAVHGALGINNTNTDSASFSSREVACFIGTPGQALATAGTGNIVIDRQGVGLRGDWKRFSVYRAGNTRLATAVTNKPWIGSSFAGPIQTYTSTSGEQYFFESEAPNGAGSQTPALAACGKIVFPARGTNKAHLYFVPTATMPTWGSGTYGVSATAAPTVGGVYLDSGASNAYGLYEHNGSAWQRLLTTDLANPLTNGGASLGANGLGWSSLILKDTGAAFELTTQFTCTGISADRALTYDLGDASRTITLSGNPTLANWFDQDVRVAASPQFVGLTLTGDLSVQGNTTIGNATTDTVRFNAGGNAAAPSTAAIGTIADYYGTSATRVLTTPNRWWAIIGDDGNTYKIPLYS